MLQVPRQVPRCVEANLGGGEQALHRFAGYSIPAREGTSPGRGRALLRATRLAPPAPPPTRL